MADRPEDSGLDCEPKDDTSESDSIDQARRAAASWKETLRRRVKEFEERRRRIDSEPETEMDHACDQLHHP